MTVALVASGASLMPPSPAARSALRCGSRRWVVAGLGAGVALHLVTVAVATVIRRSSFWSARLSTVRRWTGSSPRPLAAMLVMPAAMGEELYWRADPQPGGVAAYVACQLASRNPLLPLGALPLGLLTTWLRRRSGCLWPALFAHLAYTELTMVYPGLPAPLESTSGSPAATDP